jgi:uncharacterized protein (DUF58 family)
VTRPSTPDSPGARGGRGRQDRRAARRPRASRDGAGARNAGGSRDAAAGRGQRGSRDAGWGPTQALFRAVGLSAALLLAAVLLRRADLAVLAAPLVLGAAIGLATRPHGGIAVTLSVPPAELLEGAAVTPVVEVRTEDQVDLVMVTLRLPAGLVADGVPVAQGRLGRPGERLPVGFPLRSTRWGRRTLGPAEVRALGGYGLLRCGPRASHRLQLTTWPLREDFVATDALPFAAGMVGLHRSRRPGDGSDVVGVRPYGPGDRPRRVNWRVTQRTGEVHVTSTYSDRDADVTILLDTRHDIGVPPRSSLDTTIRAAASVAQHYLRHGDRVALVDLGRAPARVPAGNGRLHLTRILDLLLDVRVAGGHAGYPDLGRVVPPRALVVVLTPLAGPPVFTLLAGLGRTGHAVVAVDTLDPELRPDPHSPWTDLAYRLWSLERAAGIDRLAELGVPVVRWQGGGSLDDVLRDLTRATAAPRLLR